MSSNAPRPYAVAIGGFDPCGGAGVLADVKTLEAHGVFGLGVSTANTIQTEDYFDNAKSESPEYIALQLRALFARYPIAACKIGMTTSFEQLGSILDSLSLHAHNVPTIWDPVVRATAGVDDLLQAKLFAPEDILPRLTLITPNTTEFSALFRGSSPQEVVNQYRCALLLKGGHATGNTPYVEDTLYSTSGQWTFRVPRSALSKHGTGCVLASAIAAHLALGKPLQEAARLAQLYVAQFIGSHPSRLGIHGL